MSLELELLIVIATLGILYLLRLIGVGRNILPLIALELGLMFGGFAYIFYHESLPLNLLEGLLMGGAAMGIRVFVNRTLLNNCQCN